MAQPSYDQRNAEAYEPFGEHLGPTEAVLEQASPRLVRVGMAVFWSLVVTIVLARAILFDPSIFRFSQIASLF